MIRDWLTDQALTAGPIFAMVLFIALFVGVLVWVFRPGSRKRYENVAHLPLSESAPGETTGQDDQQDREEDHGKCA